MTNGLSQNICQPELRTAFSTSRDEQQAVEELYQQLNWSDLNFVLFFCSAEYQLDRLASLLQARFADILIAGCTTAGEITAMGYDQGSISAIGFSREAFAVSGLLIKQLDEFNFNDAQELVEHLTQACLDQQVAPIKNHSFALTLFDGLSTQEERVLVTLDSVLGSIPHFGGSAGDDIHLSNTHVYFDGAFCTDAAVIILVNTACEFQVFSDHHMENCDTKLVVTEADSEQRRVLELNAEPAAIEYARIVGVPLTQLNHEVFALNPIAVRIGDEYFVRSIQSVNDDLSLTFYCAVENGIVLTLMQPGELMSSLDQQLTEKEVTLGEHLITLGCDCFLRRLEGRIRGQSEQVSALLQRHRVVGFNTYGEQIDGMHVNQTFTGVAIGRKR
ncbi:nitric oxide-sensing protein NosP [Amphritea sp. 1_MG-2023]|uniref:nitric oxide-sensing protein NosP n=1 Tax=Amphritea sp. 1_MG-2023 TaxID=3062670 RepID=UPI0026E251CA|nr:nitric oxide-sensing protein NosP [Amphritea sp. 1_MG-2023]MDO6564578.1 nitric oxide-sensing protein NosP [Amphritea sp. 1_MG-2023]